MTSNARAAARRDARERLRPARRALVPWNPKGPNNRAERRRKARLTLTTPRTRKPKET